MITRRQLIQRYGVLGLALHPILNLNRASALTLSTSHLLFVYKANGFYHQKDKKNFFPSRPSSGSISSTNFNEAGARHLNGVKAYTSLFNGVYIGGGHHGAAKDMMTGGVAKRISLNNAIGKQRVLEGKSLLGSLDWGMYGYSKQDPNGSSLSYPGNGSSNHPETDPRRMYKQIRDSFNKVCKAGSVPIAKEHAYTKGLVDSHYSAYKKVKQDRKLASAEIQKMEDYLSTLREIEKELDVRKKDEEKFKAQFCSKANSTPSIPANFNQSQKFDLFNKLLLFAHQAGVTNVSTSLLCYGGRGGITVNGIGGDYHRSTHSGSNFVNKNKPFDDWFMSRAGNLMNMFKNAKDVHGKSLLDSSAIVFWADCDLGANHAAPVGSPLAIVGKGNGFFKPKYYKYPGYVVDKNGSYKASTVNQKKILITLAKYMGLKNYASVYPGYGTPLSF